MLNDFAHHQEKKYQLSFFQDEDFVIITPTAEHSVAIEGEKAIENKVRKMLSLKLEVERLECPL